jgi:hypothetical protein
MIIEFVGPPGAGKSVLARRVGEVGTARGLELRSDTLNRHDGGRWFERVAAIRANPRLAALLGRAIPGPAPRTRLATGNRLMRRDWLTRQLPPRTLLDSGVHFAACGVIRRLEIPAETLVPHLSPPYALVRLNVKPTVSLERIRQRGTDHRTLTMHEDAALRYLAEYTVIIDRVVEAARRPVVTVDADVATIDETADAIVDRLTPMLEGPRVEPW